MGWVELGHTKWNHGQLCAALQYQKHTVLFPSALYGREVEENGKEEGEGVYERETIAFQISA